MNTLKRSKLQKVGDEVKDVVETSFYGIVWILGMIFILLIPFGPPDAEDNMREQPAR